MKAAICCSEALSHRLYGFPKIDKRDVPLWPIVSTIGSPTYNLAKHLTEPLQPCIGQMEMYVQDSSRFLEKIGRLVLQPGDLMVSFDIVLLFTVVPVHEVLGHITDLFPTDVTALF